MNIRWASLALALFLALSSQAVRLPEPAPGGELRFCLHAEPKNFNPLMISEEPDEVIQYLTGSVLIRINRQTQAFEPELAESWQVVDGGRKIEFKLRDGVRFSDGAPLTPADVLFSLRSIVDPALHSPAGEPFRTDKGGDPGEPAWQPLHSDVIAGPRGRSGTAIRPVAHYQRTRCRDGPPRSNARARPLPH